MLLEVFYDDIISRGENDIKQKQIMTHFANNGFEEVPENLEKNTFNNLLSNSGKTRL